jgi:hypothetical protein
MMRSLHYLREQIQDLIRGFIDTVRPVVYLLPIMLFLK